MHLSGSKTSVGSKAHHPLCTCTFEFTEVPESALIPYAFPSFLAGPFLPWPSQRNLATDYDSGALTKAGRRAKGREIVES